MNTTGASGVAAQGAPIRTDILYSDLIDTVD
jgi:hypothetical protein